MGEHSNHLLCLLVFVAVNSRAQIIMVSHKSFSSPLTPYIATSNLLYISVGKSLTICKDVILFVRNVILFVRNVILFVRNGQHTSDRYMLTMFIVELWDTKA